MEQYCTFKEILFFLGSYQGKFHQYSKNEQSTSTIYFNKRRLSWKEYKWWELALNWFIPCSNKRNVSSLSCLICKYAEHPAPDSTSLIKPCTEQSPIFHPDENAWWWLQTGLLEPNNVLPRWWGPPFTERALYASPWISAVRSPENGGVDSHSCFQVGEG